ncbi:hypothetical protein ILUMI_19583 [Ignelater luminosus]|uniref:VWFC domain-containing protein n=1 Tax=Ignelater luminosus TaxID=2038154 RepID=A0A8K0FZS0_IGNLU|nr:hypothetical protein ILUMI_19583 [Ignelater luminosus]
MYSRDVYKYLASCYYYSVSCNYRRFDCTALECPEWLDPVSVPKDCVLTYDLNKCCSVGKLCEPKDVPTCEVDGQVYKEGQKFYPKGSCSVCVCKERYSEKDQAAYCRPLQCGTEMNHRRDLEGHCAPVYKDKTELCCPHFWTCHSQDDVVNPAEIPSKINGTCIFGRKFLKVGEYIEKTVEKYGQRHNIHCECKVPHLFLNCIIKSSEHSGSPI